MALTEKIGGQVFEREFIGKAALPKQQEEGGYNTLVTLKLPSCDTSVMFDEGVYADGKLIGRAARVQARTNPPPVCLPALNRKVGPIDLLGPEGGEIIHNPAMTILEATGIDFRDPMALADWKKHGADVQGERVCIGRDKLMDLISSVPSECGNAARRPVCSLWVRNRNLVIANAYCAPLVYGLDGVRRPSLLEDAHNFFKLIQMSQSMKAPDGLPVEPQDVSVPQRHLQLVHAALTLTDKPVKGSVLSERAARDSVETTRIVFAKNLWATRFQQWEAEGPKSAETVGYEGAQHILDSFVKPPMPDDQLGALDEFVAKKKLEYQNL